MFNKVKLAAIAAAGALAIGTGVLGATVGSNPAKASTSQTSVVRSIDSHWNTGWHWLNDVEFYYAGSVNTIGWNDTAENGAWHKLHLNDGVSPPVNGLGDWNSGYHYMNDVMDTPN